MRRVLIADDHPVTRRGLHAIVQEVFEDAEIGEASDAATAIELVTARKWDLLLLDIFMPGTGSNLDLLPRIRKAAPSLPILVITSATDLSFAIQSIKAGANGFMHKHLPPEELVRAISTVIEGGTYMPGETAAAIARSLSEDRPILPHEKLSRRELDVLRGLARGRAVKEIAGDLEISEKTVATYIARIRDKTGLQTFVEMARYALQHELVD